MTTTYNCDTCETFTTQYIVERDQTWARLECACCGETREIEEDNQ
jgi:transcription elongation factor Elf1